jgi:hypothetical protein
MTIDEFNDALKMTRIKRHVANAARLAMVYGMTQAAAGNSVEPKITRQQVNEAVVRIRRVHFRLCSVPEGWGTITLTLPKNSEEWTAAVDLERKAIERLSSDS